MTTTDTIDIADAAARLAALLASVRALGIHGPCRYITAGGTYESVQIDLTADTRLNVAHHGLGAPYSVSLHVGGSLVRHGSGADLAQLVAVATKAVSA
jgi:hypothetical protein